MPEILHFAGHSLSTSASRVASYESFSINSDVETEEEVVDEVKQVARGALGKGTISLTVPLHAGLGVDVFGEYLAWRAIADSGAKGPLYVSGRRLDDFEWMLTSVGLADPMAGPGGSVYRARLMLGFDGCLPEEAVKQTKKNKGGETDPEDPADLTENEGVWLFNTEGILMKMYDFSLAPGMTPEMALRMSALRTRAAQEALGGKTPYLPTSP